MGQSGTADGLSSAGIPTGSDPHGGDPAEVVWASGQGPPSPPRRCPKHVHLKGDTRADPGHAGGDYLSTVKRCPPPRQDLEIIQMFCCGQRVFINAAEPVRKMGAVMNPGRISQEARERAPLLGLQPNMSQPASIPTRLWPHILTKEAAWTLEIGALVF